MSKLRSVLKTSSFLKLRHYSQASDPFNKALGVLSKEVPSFLKSKDHKDGFYPEHADVVVIGGGVVGSSVAYWLKTKAGKGLNVVVLEKDLTYKEASTVLSAGGLRQQFSLPENVLLSQYCVDFLRNIKQNLGPDVDVQFAPHGYLVLANEKCAHELEKNVIMQRECGVKNQLYTPEKLKQRFPWINCEDVKLGCIGTESEGWFDPWSLLNGLTKKSQELGATYVNAKVTGFDIEQQRDVLMEGVQPGTYKKINKVTYETPDGEQRDLKFAICVLAAGAWSGRLAALAGIGTGQGLLSIPLPIEPRKRNIYCFECRGDGAPGIHTPMVVDTSGAWFRRDGLGNSYICGKSPSVCDDRPCHDLEVDNEHFDENIWPCLAHRVKAFENLKVKSAWAGWYEFNTYDENGIIGPHPYHNNFFIAAGFSGHGLQHAPGTGRAIAELILDSRYVSIDLTRLGFDRLITDRPMIESNLY